MWSSINGHKIFFDRSKLNMDANKLMLFTILPLNLLAFILMGIDKYKSKHGQWRISEKSFFIISALGGSVGVLLGMYIFRHKTRHISFLWGIPAILILQAAIAYYILS